MGKIRYNSRMRIVTYILLSILLTVLSAAISFASDKPVIVAVVDTGYTAPEKQYKGTAPIFCKFGHADFASSKRKFNQIPKDNSQLKHGTNVTHIISKNLSARNKKYCIVVIRYYGGTNDSLENSNNAFEYLSNIKPDIINFSATGSGYDSREEKLMQKLLSKGIKIVVAAGNDGVTSTTYPAGHDSRIISVGNLQANGTRHPTSNHGSLVNRWEVGTEVCGGNICLTGTSQAAAVASGKLLKELTERK